MSDPWDWTVGQVVEYLCRHAGEIFGSTVGLRQREYLESKLRNNAVNGRALLCRVDHRMLQMNLGLLMAAQRDGLLAIVERLRAESAKYQRFGNSQVIQIQQNGGPTRPPVTASPRDVGTTNTERRRVSNLVTEPLNSAQQHVTLPPSDERNVELLDISMSNNIEADGDWDYLAQRWNDDNDEEIISIGGTEEEEDLDDSEMVEDESTTELAVETPSNERNGQMTKGSKLDPEEVLDVIHSYIDEYTENWTPGRHADEVLDQAWDAHELWHELHDQDEAEQQRVIQKTKEQIEYYELRVNVIIEEILQSSLSWPNRAAVWKQCASLDHMIDFLEQEKWELDVYQMQSPPPKSNYAETSLPVRSTSGTGKPQGSTAKSGRTSGLTVQAQLNQISNRAIRQDDSGPERIVAIEELQLGGSRNQISNRPIRQDDFAPERIVDIEKPQLGSRNQISNRTIRQDESAPEQIVEIEEPQLGGSRNQQPHSQTQPSHPAQTPRTAQVEIIDLGSASDSDSDSAKMDVDEFYTPLSRMIPTEQPVASPTGETPSKPPTHRPLRTISAGRPVVPPLSRIQSAERPAVPPAQVPRRAQPTTPPPRVTLTPIPRPTGSTPSEPMLIDSEPNPAPLSSPSVVLPSVETAPASSLPSIPLPRFSQPYPFRPHPNPNNQRRAARPAAPLLLITPPPPPPSTHPVTLSPSTASYATISRWTWPDLVASCDRKRIVLKVLQEMSTSDREAIRSRIMHVKKTTLISEIKECVGMMMQGKEGIPGFLAKDVVKIVKFTRLFLCWWLAGDYFVHGDGEEDGLGRREKKEEKEVPMWRLRELEQCLRDEETQDPRVFCEWVRWVMERTFSEEALAAERRWAPSQAEVIVISDDEG
ncbi:uncharacterized protein EI97DRAFT_469319 [Westerdykella ornata]|uniref:DUF7607 domain-containing protein n=1 Tax=Westerdykella ornata TaxID=318751 RepID=A0A6A6JF86_WESOR|nr:uncharacterized protein EI97DRAFT_469319 [Westerdykella ornata]KAF2273839.1 hypothetical protein EI97DRAFT_469319 [Westerdykella ornata]